MSVNDISVCVQIQVDSDRGPTKWERKLDHHISDKLFLAMQQRVDLIWAKRKAFEKVLTKLLQHAATCLPFFNRLIFRRLKQRLNLCLTSLARNVSRH